MYGMYGMYGKVLVSGHVRTAVHVRRMYGRMYGARLT